MRQNWMLGLLLLLTSALLTAAPLTILVGQHKPPYIDTANISGYEIELLAEIVTRMGFEPVFVFVPNARIKTLLEAGQGDIASLQPITNDETGLFYSQPYIRYENVVVSRKADEFIIQHSSDLVRYSVLAFQNAHRVLGQDFADMTKQSRYYRETVDQQIQLNLLLHDRVQVIVMDRNIYNHYLMQADHGDRTKVHHLFPATYYRAALRDVKLQRQFDRALLSVQLDNWHARLQRKYFADVNQQLPNALLCSN